MMKLDVAKAHAFSAAGHAFLRSLKENVGLDGVSQLAGTGPEEHVGLIQIGEGKMFTAHVTVTFSPIDSGPSLDDVFDDHPANENEQ